MAELVCFRGKIWKNIFESDKIIKNRIKRREEYTKAIIQMSRAAGIYLIISTQRPSVDVITGTIKANILTRIAFKVPAQVDSRVILDRAGAEKLLNCGDALFVKNGFDEPIRMETPYISDDEIKNSIIEVSKNRCEQCREDIIEFIEKDCNKDDNILEENEVDILLNEAIEAVIETGYASTSFIQRRFKINYIRAGKIIDQMEKRGIISEYMENKPRKVLMTKEKWSKLNITVYSNFQSNSYALKWKNEEGAQNDLNENNMEKYEEKKKKVNETFFIIWLIFIVIMMFGYMISH